MKIKLILFLSLIVLISSCQDEGVAVQKDSLNDESSNELFSTHFQVIKMRDDFFSWYKINRDEFYGKQNSCVKIESGYYELDPTGLNEFCQFLSNSQFFSNDLIKEIRTEWQNGCENEMLRLKSEGIEADGPPPCVWEGDVFFLTQEDPSEEDYASIGHDVLKKTIDTVVLDTGITELTWIKEEGSWRIRKF